MGGDLKCCRHVIINVYIIIVWALGSGMLTDLRVLLCLYNLALYNIILVIQYVHKVRDREPKYAEVC